MTPGARLLAAALPKAPPLPLLPQGAPPPVATAVAVQAARARAAAARAAANQAREHAAKLAADALALVEAAAAIAEHTAVAAANDENPWANCS